MWWMVGLILMELLGRALAQDSRGSTEEMEVENAKRAADWAIVRFNTDIQDFPSWEAFKTVVLSQVVSGTLGTCYEYSGGTVQITKTPLPREDTAAVWQKTPGNGWQQVRQDRTVIEYRVNTKAGLLLWSEGVKPRFFFAYTRQMCEVPLDAIRP